MAIYQGIVSGAEYIGVDASATTGIIPGIWRPSVMYGNSTSDIIDMFEGISGGRGLLRLVSPFGFTDWFGASSQGDFITKFTAYLNQSEVQTALARGTCLFEVTGPPTYLASGTTLYQSAKVPSDNSAGGSWQLFCTLMCQTAQSVLGSLYRSPRNGSGQIEIGQPGLIWECGNEWGGGTGTQLSNCKTTYQRFWQGFTNADANAAVTLPGPVSYSTAEGTGKTFIREMCEFAGSNGCPPRVMNWHSFQGLTANDGLPSEHVDAANAEVTASLAAGGLDPATPRVHTEFQSNLPGTPGADSRNNYQSAAYFANALWEHWQTGSSGMCMASLIKQGNTPTDAAPFAESGAFAGWGMVTRGTVRIPTAQFSLSKLFALWDGGQALSISGRTTTQVRHFAARSGNDVVVLASRWNTGAGTRPLDIAAKYPGKTLTETRLYRFDATQNNVQKIFADTVGTDIQKGQAAQAAGLSPSYTVETTYPLRLQFADIDTAVVRFIFA